MASTSEYRSTAGPLTDDDRPYLIVSGDSHAGPLLDVHLRKYCPKSHLSQYDEFCAETRQRARRNIEDLSSSPQYRAFPLPAALEAKLALSAECAGAVDAGARLKDMDESGITAEAIFAGHTNGHVLPWAGPFSAGSASVAPELRALGIHIWNQWLADFVTAAPERLLGVMHIPIWDVKAAIKEIEWGKEHGLRAINFPSSRPDFPAYNEDIYEPLWSAVEAVDLPLLTHVASGATAPGQTGKGAMMIQFTEIFWLGRRSLPQLLFGGVFERHPSLRLAFVEQGGDWVMKTLQEYDAVYRFVPEFMPVQLGEISGAGVTFEPDQRAVIDYPAKLPSEYFATNCYVANSFMTPGEVRFRHEVGLENLLWGSDYPHLEGTWPNTKVALRNTFWSVPHDESRIMLEDAGVRLFALDVEKLRPIADRIGPTPAELSVPVTPSELPAYGGFAFREETDYFG